MKNALVLSLATSALLLGCNGKKGIEGASCSASSDCDGSLQCVLNTCVDVEKAAAAAAETAKRNEENLKSQEALMSVLKDLRSEQERLAKEKAELDVKLAKVTDEAERARIMAEIDAKQAEIDANAAKVKKASSRSGSSGAAAPRKPAIEVKKMDDPLDGL